MKRATINVGLRYDYVMTSADPQVLPANTMLPERTFAGIDKIIAYHDLSPRFGVAYDLFGNNRTAVKAAVNRYLYPQDFAGGRHPTTLATPNTLRDFTDGTAISSPIAITAISGRTANAARPTTSPSARRC